MATAKKPAAKKAAPKVQVETVSYEAEAPVVAKVKEAAPVAPKDTWEIKDRVYILATRKTPIVMTLPTRHTQKRPLLWFDEQKGYEREIRYATNQRSIFVDEQEGHVTLAHIVFRDGTLVVPKAKQALQKLLSLYHPLNGLIYKELDEVKNAVDDLDWMDLQLEASNAAANMEIELAEAILRVEVGNAVSSMKSKEIRRDVRIMAINDPKLFLELANDENIELRNVGVKAVEAGVLELANDQRTFMWKATNRKIMTVPFGENPYSALAAFFKTDDGIEIYQSIVKRI